MPDSLRDGLLDLIAPRWCEGCGEPLREGSGFLCADCRAHVRLVPGPHCSLCFRTSGVEVCPDCARRRHAFSACVAGGLYEGRLARLVHALKYRGKTHLAGDLAGLIADAAAGRGEARLVDGLAYVPMTHRAERERGYNQAALIADALAGRWRVPVYGALARIREGAPQVGLPAAERRRNVSKAFGPVRGADLSGACIGLVDDVMTTGATADECAKALTAAGAAKVVVLVAARDL